MVVLKGVSLTSLFMILKTPDSSQRPHYNCPKCGNPVDGLYCRQCALLRKKLKEVWFTLCDENEIFQDFLNTSDSSNENINIINAPQEPFVFNQDRSENSSQCPPHIDHHCCYGCGDSLDESDEFIKSSVENLVLIPSESEDFFDIKSECDMPDCDDSQTTNFSTFSNPIFDNSTSSDDESSHEEVIHEMSFKTYSNPLFYLEEEIISNLQQRMNDSMIELRETFQAWLQQQEQVVNLDSYTLEPSQYRMIPIYYDDDDDEDSSIPLKELIIPELPPCIAITPVLSTEEPVDSLIMEDEHLDTILATKSDELIKSSVEDLVPIPSESGGISDDTCDVPFCNNSPPFDVLNNHFEIFSDFNDDCTSSDDDSFEDIDYVEASPPDSEIVSLEEVNDEILRVKLLNVNLLIAKIESLNDNPTPDRVLKSPSPFPIPVEDSDTLFEKFDTSLLFG
uniref:Uncharacterized protein n=1 Tax=Tanacetum cinerariifolium TaxID=118510 RepID=A0A6L2KC33_TANCI|nr:hypothetical protein [Tanacetum cinerariifolium]